MTESKIQELTKKLDATTKEYGYCCMDRARFIKALEIASWELMCIYHTQSFNADRVHNKKCKMSEEEWYVWLLDNVDLYKEIEKSDKEIFTAINDDWDTK